VQCADLKRREAVPCRVGRGEGLVLLDWPQSARTADTAAAHDSVNARHCRIPVGPLSPSPLLSPLPQTPQVGARRQGSLPCLLPYPHSSLLHPLQPPPGPRPPWAQRQPPLSLPVSPSGAGRGPLRPQSGAEGGARCLPPMAARGSSCAARCRPRRHPSYTVQPGKHRAEPRFWQPAMHEEWPCRASGMRNRHRRLCGTYTGVCAEHSTGVCAKHTQAFVRNRHRRLCGTYTIVPPLCCMTHWRQIPSGSVQRPPRVPSCPGKCKSTAPGMEQRRREGQTAREDVSSVIETGLLEQNPYMGGTACRVSGTRYRIQGTRYRIQGTRYRIQGTRYRIQKNIYIYFCIYIHIHTYICMYMFYVFNE